MAVWLGGGGGGGGGGKSWKLAKVWVHAALRLAY
jgi:hypothetical protein